MSKVAPALSLLCAITFATAMTPAFAEWKEHPENSWKYYLANCQRMQEKWPTSRAVVCPAPLR